MLGIGISSVVASTQEAGALIGSRVQPYANTHAVTLDGTGDVVTLLTQARLQTLLRCEQGTDPKGYAISFWIYDDAYATSFLMGFDDHQGTVDALSLRYISGYLQTKVSANGSTSTSLGFAGLSSNTWHNIIFSVERGDGSSDTSTVRVFVDGVQKVTHAGPTKANTDAAAPTSGANLAFGARRLPTTDAYDGHISAVIDEIAIWNHHFTADQAAAVFNSRATFDLRNDSGNYDLSSRLQYYYRLNNDRSDTMGVGADAGTEGDPTFTTSPTPV